jgi:hypothetical protein
VDRGAGAIGWYGAGDGELSAKNARNRFPGLRSEAAESPFRPHRKRIVYFSEPAGLVPVGFVCLKDAMDAETASP